MDIEEKKENSEIGVQHGGTCGQREGDQDPTIFVTLVEEGVTGVVSVLRTQGVDQQEDGEGENSSPVTFTYMYFIYLDYFQKSSMARKRERQEAFLRKFDLGELDDQMMRVAEEQFTELEVKEDLIEDADSVHDSLERHMDAWREIGASRFALSVISNGYRVPFTSFPCKYGEKNNKSFKDNEKWGVEQVLVLLKQKRVMEVDQADVLCCNPLSVAVNSKGKKRLVIDLSRHVNPLVDKKTFKIESTESALDIIEQGSWLVSFDIRGAYHHIKLAEDQWKYFGFCCVIEGRLRPHML